MVLPMETKYENPIFSSTAQSNTVVHIAPDWEIKAILPFLGIPRVKVILRCKPGTIKPTQFGPIILMPSNFASSTNTWSSSILPSWPDSLKPADKIMIPLIPASPHSLTNCGTSFALVAITAKSGVLGRLITLG